MRGGGRRGGEEGGGRRGGGRRGGGRRGGGRRGGGRRGGGRRGGGRREKKEDIVRPSLPPFHFLSHTHHGWTQDVDLFSGGKHLSQQKVACKQPLSTLPQYFPGSAVPGEEGRRRTKRGGKGRRGKERGGEREGRRGGKRGGVGGME